MNGTHIGNINGDTESSHSSSGFTSSATIILSTLSVLGVLAILVGILAFRKRRRIASTKRFSSMKNASFDRYLNDIESVQVVNGTGGSAVVRASPFGAVPISSIQTEQMVGNGRFQGQYSNPSADAKNNSTEFKYTAPQKNTTFGNTITRLNNRLSMKLYQNKMVPRKKVMLPVLSNNCTIPIISDNGLKLSQLKIK
jgi:hypothetical protein